MFVLRLLLQLAAGNCCPGLPYYRIQLTGEAGESTSPTLTLCTDSYSVSVPLLVLPQWQVKDPGHSAKSAGGKLHLNTHKPLTQRSR